VVANQAVVIKPWQADFANKAAVLHAKSMMSSWTLSQWQALNPKLTYGAAAFSGDVMVGVAILNAVAGESELQTIAVDEAFRGKGLSKDLFRQTVRMLPSDTSTMFLEVDSANSVAINLYSALNFTQCGLRRGYYKHSAGNGDAIIMSKELNHASNID